MIPLLSPIPPPQKWIGLQSVKEKQFGKISLAFDDHFIPKHKKAYKFRTDLKGINEGICALQRLYCSSL